MFLVLTVVFSAHAFAYEEETGEPAVITDIEDVGESLVDETALAGENEEEGVPADQDIESGTFGERFSYVFNHGVLTVTGVGDMPDCYSSNRQPWYNLRNEIESVILSSGVTRIGNYAFSECALTSISIPDSVTVIGNSSFRGCQGLTEITLPANLTTIYNYAFYGSSLTSIELPDSVTTINNYGYRLSSAKHEM